MRKFHNEFGSVIRTEEPGSWMYSVCIGCSQDFPGFGDDAGASSGQRCANAEACDPGLQGIGICLCKYVCIYIYILMYLFICIRTRSMCFQFFLPRSPICCSNGPYTLNSMHLVSCLSIWVCWSGLACGTTVEEVAG